MTRLHCGDWHPPRAKQLPSSDCGFPRSAPPGLHFHDLWHTASTLVARTGATMKELVARLGHARPGASLIYQHAAEDRERIADGLADMGGRGWSFASGALHELRWSGTYGQQVRPSSRTPRA